MSRRMSAMFVCRAVGKSLNAELTEYVVFRPVRCCGSMRRPIAERIPQPVLAQTRIDTGAFVNAWTIIPDGNFDAVPTAATRNPSVPLSRPL